MPSTAPVVPPRPSRSPRPGPSTPSGDIPKVPPRPSNRRFERSTSPSTGSFAPSPSNEIPSSGRTQSQDESSSNIPTSSPSVTLPTLGQEGTEYEDLHSGTTVDGRSQVQEPPVEQKRDIGSDVKLHAPRPSLPSSTARAKVQAVTHTNSYQAAASGFGKAVSPSHDQPDLDNRPRSNTNGSETASIEHRTSAQPRDEQGIPGIGQQDELAREEQEQYGPGLSTERAESLLSSEELNRDSASRNVGLGTSSTAIATSEEELGFASEEFTSQNPMSYDLERSQSKDSQAAAESPSRKPYLPTYEDEQLRESSNIWNEDATSGNNEDAINIDEPHYHQHHPDEDHSHWDTRTNSQDYQDHDKEEDVPILASDEVEPSSEHMQTAVSPPLEGEEGSSPVDTHSNVPTRARLNSRDEEIEETHTPSEDVKEYEPPFPEDGNKDKENEPLSPTDRFKQQRPEHIQHKSPSQGTWEESPDRLHTTVSTGNSSESSNEEAQKEDTEKLASQIQVSKNHLEEEAADRPHMKQRFSSSVVWEDASETHQPVATAQTPEPEEMKNQVETMPSKPSIPPRPDTNKAGEQSQDTSTPPPIPSRPQKRVLKAPPFNTQAKPPSESNVMNASQPAVSPTESRKVPVLPDRPKPQLPTRPARPAARGSSESLSRVNSGGSAESGGTSKNAPAAPPKPKPVVPTKPGGSKIAALKAGLLSDLDKTLMAGPKPPEKKEKPEAPAEKGPLSDARKGRARGPARRKPAVTPLPKLETPPTEPSAPEIKITGSWSVWQVSEDGAVIVGGDKEPVEKLSTPEPSSSPVSSTKETTNDATEPAPSEAVEDKASPTKESPVDDAVPDHEEIKLSTDETSKSDEPESSTILSRVETSPPNDTPNKSDEDETKDDEQPQSETVPGGTIEPETESPSAPIQSKEDQDSGDEDETLTDKELDQMSPPVDEKKHSGETIKSEG